MTRPRSGFLVLALAVFFSSLRLHAEDFDVVVYGGTSAGVVAAVQAKAMGKSVLLIGPDRHLGGMSSGGLGFSDTGNPLMIGGLSREFYHRIWLRYRSDPSCWNWQSRARFTGQGQGVRSIDDKNQVQWTFEPHIAEAVFDDWVREAGVTVVRGAWLDRAKGVELAGGRITAITALGGQTYRGKIFIDATYEGDLMAAAGVSYHTGREANSAFGEEHNGVQIGHLYHRHNFAVLATKLSPYVVPDDPSSGLVAHVSGRPPGAGGEGDNLIQAYCYRMCLTNVPENRIPFAAPAGYDPKEFELLARVYAAGWKETFEKFDSIPNGKTDTNNHGPFSTDDIGADYDYPEGSYEQRRAIAAEHERYQRAWFYFIASDPRVPADVRERMSSYGLARDEFKDNGGWPTQFYVREARRMMGEYVVTENDIRKLRPTPDSIGMGSYTIDSHNVQRYVTPDGSVENEGDVGAPSGGPYVIPYGALVPQRGQVSNLLVPVCLSSTHAAYSSIRMEPVLMIVAQSAATAAALALDANQAVQDVSYGDLRAHLLAGGQVLSDPRAHEPGRPVAVNSLGP